jgi:hypothetical protein
LTETLPLLAFGEHPDDIEFGSCGVIYPNKPLVLQSLTQEGEGARQF